MIELGGMHHIAYVVKDPEATRHFYEDVLGLPLIATWAEIGPFKAYPGRQIEFCHTFFALPDGSTLAFFAFADDEVYETLRNRNGIAHVALGLKAEAQREMRSAAWKRRGTPPATSTTGMSRLCMWTTPTILSWSSRQSRRMPWRLAERQRSTAGAHIDAVAGRRSHAKQRPTIRSMVAASGNSVPRGPVMSRAANVAVCSRPAVVDAAWSPGRREGLARPSPKFWLALVTTWWACRDSGPDWWRGDYIECDLADRASLAAGAEAVRSMGGLWALVNNAAVAAADELATLSVEESGP